LLGKNLINLQEKDEKLFCAASQKEFQCVYSKNYKNLYILSNGLCLCKDSFWLFYGFSKFSLKLVFIWMLRIILALLKVREKTIVSNALLLTDQFSKGFFHWFGDVLQKIEALEKTEIKLESYILILPKIFATNFAIETLKNYNLNYKIIEEKEILIAKNLTYIPQISPTGNYRPELLQ